MATPELFTVTFWQVTATQIINAAAGGAVGALASAAVGTIGDVPWYGVLSAAGLSALTTLLLALAGKVSPNTGPAALFVPPPKAVKQAPRPKAPRRKTS